MVRGRADGSVGRRKRQHGHVEVRRPQAVEQVVEVKRRDWQRDVSGRCDERWERKFRGALNLPRTACGRRLLQRQRRLSDDLGRRCVHLLTEFATHVAGQLYCVGMRVSCGGVTA